MRIASFVLSVVFCAFVVSGPATADHHEMAGPAVAITLIFDAGGDPAQVVELAGRAIAIATKAGSQGKQRVFNVAFGGTSSDSVVIVVEYPNMAAFADSFTKVGASPEFQKLSSEFRAAGIRLISRSIMIEIGK